MWVKGVFEEAKEIVLFFKNHQKILAIFREFSKTELVVPNLTRFATMFLMMERLHTVHGSLRQVVTSPIWKQFLDNNSNNIIKEKGFEIECRILDTGRDFWPGMKKIIDICEPIVSLLRLVDGPKPTTGKIWKHMEVLGKKLLVLLEDEEDKQREVSLKFEFKE